MIALGMLILGAFIGFVCIYAVLKISDWNKPASVLSGVLSAAVSGGLFALFERFAVTPIGDMIYFYPVGLGYGALCPGLRWLAGEGPKGLKLAHIGAFTLVSVLVVALMLWEDFRALLPTA
ncbi:MAG: hypothetical protein WA979_06210 [Pacificimonas sp.]